MALALVLRDFEGGVRVQLGEGGDGVDGDTGSGMHPHANHVLFSLLEQLRVTRDALERSHRGCDAVADVCAGGGEADAAPRPLEELDAELLFQSMDRLGEGRLGDVKLPGRVGHMLVFGHGEEVSQLKQFHGWIHSIRLNLLIRF